MSSENKDNKFAIVTGATGATGYFIVKRLLEKGYQVRIITRNYEHSKKVLGDLFEKLETPIICDLDGEARQLEKKIEQNKVESSLLDFAFAKGSNGKIPNLFICCSARKSSSKGVKQESKYIEYVCVKLLVQLCVKHNIDKFVLVSALGITKPYNPFTLLINMIANDVMHWKQQAENYIRESGLQYVITRPGGLSGNHSTSSPQNYTIGQGDKLGGMVQRATVGYQLVDLLSSGKDIPKKLTYEIISAGNDGKQPYEFKSQNLVEDNSSSIIKGNQLSAKNNVKFTLIGLLFAIFLYFVL